MKLADLKVGEKGRVKRVEGGLLFKERLLELGLSPGAEVTLRARLPFGGPLIFRVDSTILALRKCEADFIEVGA